MRPLPWDKEIGPRDVTQFRETLNKLGTKPEVVIMPATPRLQKVETTKKPASKSKGRKVSLNKSGRKAPAKQETKGKMKAKTVKKKTENGVVEVEVHQYSPALSREFDTSIKEAESVKAFKKQMKANPEFKGAHKEHCKRKRYEVQNGKTAWDYAEDVAIGILIGLGAYGGTVVIRDQVAKRRAERELEVS